MEQIIKESVNLLTKMNSKNRIKLINSINEL